MTELTDRTNTIRSSVTDVEFELVLAVILVVLVIFLFLRNLPATFIPSLSVPLSIVGTFAAMYLLGFSLNNLSLMALTISAGFVVDDAIVLIENITRYLEKGEKPLAAALRGSGEIGFTIVSLTISLIAVLILQAILSWVNPHAPIAPALNQMTAPFLEPLRKVIPLVGGVDLSPLVLILIVYVVLDLLQTLLIRMAAVAA